MVLTIKRKQFVVFRHIVSNKAVFKTKAGLKWNQMGRKRLKLSFCTVTD